MIGDDILDPYPEPKPLDPYPVDPRRPIDPYGKILGVQTIPQTGGPYIDHDTVLAVQKALLDSGYSVGASGADGLWGKDTAAGVKAMQSAKGIPVTGVIDYGVLNALGVPAPKNAPTKSTMGNSASAAAQDVARTANNAAAEADKADTPSDLQGAADAVSVAANSTPPAPADVQAKVKAAQAKAHAAKTPEEVKAAAKDVVVAGNLVSVAAVGWWSQPAWTGAPVKRWHAIAGAGAMLVLSSTLLIFLRRK